MTTIINTRVYVCMDALYTHTMYAWTYVYVFMYDLEEGAIPGSCSCPTRSSDPTCPVKLPFPVTPENNGKTKSWLLETFASSTFNTYPHQPLPVMKGPPIKIHMQEDVKPKACHTPASIPLHWQKQVHADLLRDEALRVIETIPMWGTYRLVPQDGYNQETEWLSQKDS